MYQYLDLPYCSMLLLLNSVAVYCLYFLPTPEFSQSPTDLRQINWTITILSLKSFPKIRKRQLHIL